MLIVAAASAITANFFFIVIIPLFLFLKIYVFLDVYNLAKINRKINCAFMDFWHFRQFGQYKFIYFDGEINTNLYYNRLYIVKSGIF